MTPTNPQTPPAPMPDDIIGVVRELQATVEHKRFLLSGSPELASVATDEEQLLFKAGLGNDMLQHFPSIAQALLERDEKLRIAVEALEREEKMPDHAFWVDEALSRIRSQS